MHVVLKRLVLICCTAASFLYGKADNTPLFPTDIAVGANGELVMTEKGRKRLAVYSADGQKRLRTFALDGTPTGVAVVGSKAYVTTSDDKGGMRIISLTDGTREAATVTGMGACAPIVSTDKKCVYVCNQFQNTVSEIDLGTNKVTRTVKVLREPRGAVLSHDGRYLFVTNFLPSQRADVDYVAACVSVIEISSFKKVKDLKLANGSNALRGICMSPDGKYVYVSHNLGRFAVPTSQLQQGWMNTSAFSIIDAEKQEYLGTIVTDEPERGAAGVWGVACDEEHIYISHSGTHEISVINQRELLKQFLECPDKQSLEYDLNFLYGIRERIPVKGNGPRNMVLSNGKLIIPTYFSDILNIIDTRNRQGTSVALNPDRQETDVQKGERHFNDASHCFQGWQSCNGCHPGDARSDGMNWDLMNDGIGNPKNCKSLLYSHPTPPSMISGIRESAEVAVWAGFKFIQFFDISQEDAACVDAYLKSLKAVKSPYLVDGELSKKAQEGKKVFDRLKCGECHSGIYYTDCKTYRIGDDIEFEKGWDTPTLCEVWRTAPYLFDGRAATLKEVFSVHRHGLPKKKVSEKDIDALTEYVNSL